MTKTHGIEDYLEAIYVLQAEGNRVISSELADYLGVARPTVAQALQRMEKAGIAARRNHHEIYLTEKGLRLAETSVRKHGLVECWLTNELGLNWADSHLEACRIEHAISPLVEQRLSEHLGHPTTCPHGNVIPGEKVDFVIGIPLSQCCDGEHVTVLRISGYAEKDLNLMKFFYKAKLMPGTEVTVIRGATLYEAGIEIQIENENHVLQPAVAGNVMVESSSRVSLS